MYGLGTTFGTAGTDRMQIGVTPTTGLRTYAFRGTINAAGGGGLGRFLDAEPNTSNTEAWFREASSNRIIYNRTHTSQNGAWSCPCPADVSGEHTYSISVDGSGTAAPTMYFDGISNTVTVGTAPSGSSTSNTAPIYLGNRSPDWGRGFDGKMRGWAIWNAILTAQEHLDFHNGADPKSNTGWTSGTAPSGLVAYIPMETGNVDPDGVIVSVTGAKLIGPAVASGGTGTGVGTGTGGTATGASTATTLISPEDRGNIWLAQSSITNATSVSPTVLMSPRRQVNEQKNYSGTDDTIAKGYFFYGATAGVNGKTPTYKMKFWSSSTHSEAAELFKWHYVTPLDATYKPVWSYDGRNWNYFDHCGWNADGLYLDFYNDAPFTQDMVYIASAFPWQTDKTAEWISTLIALGSPYLLQPPSALAYGGDPYQIGLTTARQNELGETIAPVKVYALRISSGGLDPNGHQKAEVVLCSGTHAGEDLGNWCLKGATEFLLTEHPKAILARAWCNFTIPPVNDSSGRRGGHRRSHFDSAKLTADGNRYWGLGTLANTNMIVSALLLDTGGHFAASFDFHAGHATPGYYDAQVQTSNDTWHAAIQTYIPSITRYLGDIANSMMGWAENTIGAKICITPEYNSDTTHTIAEVEAFGANHMKALADVAATNYLYTATPGVASGGTGVSVGSGFGGDAVGVTNATATGGTGAGAGSGSGGNASGASGTPGTASGGTGTGTGLGTGGNASGVTNAIATGGTETGTGSGSGGDAAGIVAGSATASGGIGSGVGLGSGGSASAVANAAANGGTGTSTGSGRGGTAHGVDSQAPEVKNTITAWSRLHARVVGQSKLI